MEGGGAQPCGEFGLKAFEAHVNFEQDSAMLRCSESATAVAAPSNPRLLTQYITHGTDLPRPSFTTALSEEHRQCSTPGGSCGEWRSSVVPIDSASGLDIMALRHLDGKAWCMH